MKNRGKDTLMPSTENNMHNTRTGARSTKEKFHNDEKIPHQLHRNFCDGDCKSELRKIPFFGKH